MSELPLIPEDLRQPVTDLNVSVRIGDALAEARIASVGELTRLTEADLLRLGFRRRQIRWIRRALEEEGLELTETRPVRGQASSGRL